MPWYSRSGLCHDARRLGAHALRIVAQAAAACTTPPGMEGRRREQREQDGNGDRAHPTIMRDFRGAVPRKWRERVASAMVGQDPPPQGMRIVACPARCRYASASTRAVAIFTASSSAAFMLPASALLRPAMS